MQWSNFDVMLWTMELSLVENAMVGFHCQVVYVVQASIYNSWVFFDVYIFTPFLARYNLVFANRLSNKYVLNSN